VWLVFKVFTFKLDTLNSSSLSLRQLIELIASLSKPPQTLHVIRSHVIQVSTRTKHLSSVLTMPGLSPLFFPTLLYRQLIVTPQIPDRTSFDDQVVIITGSNVGLGLEAARNITALNASKVILAVRSVDKGEAAKKSIEEATGRTGVVEVWELDLQRYDSVKAFAKRAQKLPRLDIVLENAAIATDKWTIAEGNESTITTNVISTFLLALLLLPKMRETSTKFNTRPILTVVSSDAHIFTSLEEQKENKIFEALRNEEGARTALGERYNVSKLLEILVCQYWTSESGPMGSDYPITLNMINPGFCRSELTRDVQGILVYVLALFKFLLARSTEVGSRTLVHAAVAGEETHGKYLSECQVIDASSVTKGEQGFLLSKRVWDELSDILEDIEPGITKNF
jgi:retinol dehydrogenase-12